MGGEIAVCGQSFHLFYGEDAGPGRQSTTEWLLVSTGAVSFHLYVAAEADRVGGSWSKE